MSIGLVLEGGAMRGMFTAGVLDVFLDYNITVDCAVGVSAGALFGVNYISEQKGRVIRYNKRFNKDKSYMGLRPLITEGNIVSTEYAYDRVPKHLDLFDDEAFMKSTVPFYAVITDIHSGNPEYIRINSVFSQMDTLRASGSMPFVSKPVEINGKQYLDGGLSDSIPFEWLSAQGCDKLVVILTRDIDYRKKPMNRVIVHTYKHKFPAVYKRLKHRHELYNKSVEKLKEWEKQGKAFVIRPSQPIEISRIEKDEQKLQSVYDIGVKDATAALPELLKYISE